LYLIVASCVYAFVNKNKMPLKYAIAFTFCFVSFKAFDNWRLYHQKKIIVYNIARHKAVEFIDSNNFLFNGDKEVMDDKLLNSYNLKPVQIAFQLKDAPEKLKHLFSKKNFYQFYNSRILMIDSSFTNYHSDKKIKINHILISKNPKIKIADIEKAFDCKSFIFDASNAPWKIEQWKKECEELHLQSYSVPEKGAFVINL
jgi:competence protein ComEC